jgi:hypothetical protein
VEANYSFLGLINEFAVNPTKDLNLAVYQAFILSLNSS